MDIAMDEFRAMQRELQALRAIEAIKRVKHAYCRCVDTANLEELRTLLDEEVVVHFASGSFQQVVRGREDYLRLIAGMANDQMLAQHTVHHPEIDLVSDVEATGIWYLHGHYYRLWDMHHVTGTALYRDRYVRTGDRWQIRESRYESLYELDYLMQDRPPITAHLLSRTGRPAQGE